MAAEAGSSRIVAEHYLIVRVRVCVSMCMCMCKRVRAC